MFEAIGNLIDAARQSVSGIFEGAKFGAIGGAIIAAGYTLATVSGVGPMALVGTAFVGALNGMWVGAAVGGVTGIVKALMGNVDELSAPTVAHHGGNSRASAPNEHEQYQRVERELQILGPDVPNVSQGEGRQL